MPPVIILVAGAIGAFVAARWIARAAQQVNADLRTVRQGNAEPDPVRLRRDADGTYRPG